jgi:hypothetical protein
MLALAGLSACSVAPQLFGQEPKVKRHPGEHLHYSVRLNDGDIDNITGVSVSLGTVATGRPDQQLGTRFEGECQKSSDPKIWTCDVLIPSSIVDGDYQLNRVGVGAGRYFGKSYTEDFHVPVVPIQNPDTFNPPSKVSVTEQH